MCLGGGGGLVFIYFFLFHLLDFVLFLAQVIGTFWSSPHILFALVLRPKPSLCAHQVLS